jgi:hypothetical protein
MEDYVKCIEYCNKVLKIRDNKGSLYCRAQSFMKIGNCRGAIKDFERVLQHDSNDKNARTQRGLCQNYIAENKKSIIDSPVSYE